MKRFVIATLAGIMLITTSAFAQNNRSNVQSAREKMRMFRESLTEEQIEQIKNIRQDWQKKAIQIRADVHVAQIELRDLIDDDSASESRIRSQLEKISSSQIDIKMGGIALKNNLKKVLTQEQLENLPDRGFNRRYFMMGRRHRHVSSALNFMGGMGFHPGKDDHHDFDVIEDDHEKQIEEDEDIEQMNNDLMKEFSLN